MLAEKLHLKPGMRFAVVNAPPGFQRTLGKLPAGVTQVVSLKGTLDLVLLFLFTRKELKNQWPKALKSLKPDSSLWVAYPKKSSGVDSDLAEMNGDWDVCKNSAWQPVAVIAVDDIWSAVRFKQRPDLERARAARSEEGIRDADGTVCIDRKNRVVTPPGDLRGLLDRHTKAAAAFDALSFTNRKEYVVWIIDAKRPETRAARLSKTVELLSKGRKNPSDK
jgi:bacteriocin resistance YdeI/OmpD-like protein